MAHPKATKATKSTGTTKRAGRRADGGDAGDGGAPAAGRVLSRKAYERELGRLQIELVKLQEWIRHEGLKVVVLFEGRDAAGKGGTIKRITESLNPRICRVVALGTPPSGSGPSGTSSGTWPSFPPRARWCCSTAAGTTAPGWNG